MAFLFLIQYFSHGASLLRPDPVFLDDLADLGVSVSKALLTLEISGVVKRQNLGVSYTNNALEISLNLVAVSGNVINIRAVNVNDDSLYCI